MDDVTSDDIAARRIHRTLAGPKPYSDPLGRLIAPTIPPEPADSPDSAKYRRRQARLRVRRSLELLALLTHNDRLAAALAHSHP